MNKNISIRVTGDVHGLVSRYVDTLMDDGVEYSVQVGDMGFDYSPLRQLDPENHKFLGGNHDNYDFYNDNAYALGDYGMRELNGVKFFVVRGAFSIDKQARIENEFMTGRKSWWRQEQLSNNDLWEATSEYERNQPEIMITHTAPKTVVDMISNPGVLKAFGWNPDTFSTPTQNALDIMFKMQYKPKLWVFGHFHKSVDITVENTRFICLPELQYIDINANGEIKC